MASQPVRSLGQQMPRKVKCIFHPHLLQLRRWRERLSSYANETHLFECLLEISIEFKRRPSGIHFGQYAPERPPVYALAVSRTKDEFRCHEFWRSAHRERKRDDLGAAGRQLHGRRKPLCHAAIAQPEVSVLADQAIFRLDVAVHESPAVQKGQAGHNIGCEEYAFFVGKDVSIDHVPHQVASLNEVRQEIDGILILECPE
mmetsp:Transcript_12486/g.26920  ORF Transcript_12486/g.26920 Transcript_12486/m.26920 type:complete len:201 (-) Transcript_12486:612-1214(-)